LARSFRVPLYLCTVLASLPACGGKVSGADVDLPGAGASSGLPGTGKPAALRSFELRLTDRSNETALIGCAGYTVGFTVYFRSRSLTTRYCEHTEQSNISSDSQPLLDTDLDRIQSAYDQLRPVSSLQCSSSPEWLSLDVKTEKLADRRKLFDVEHSGCPRAEAASKTYVEGLGELYGVLAELWVK